MLLTIDAGNTNTVFAVFDGEAVVGHWRISTDARRTADEYAVWLLQLLQMRGLDSTSVTASVLSSVVPSAVFPLYRLCRDYFAAEPLIVGAEGVEIGMNITVDRPQEVGADRLVNALAAYRLHGETGTIIIDFGTATTFDVINDAGEYTGGVIAPGINLSLEALHKAAAKLPNVAVRRPPSVIGTTTVTAMQSGVFYGYVGLIEGIVSRIRAEVTSPLKTIATGGLAPLFARATDVIEHLDTDLTIHGLRLIHEINHAHPAHAHHFHPVSVQED